MIIIIPSVRVKCLTRTITAFLLLLKLWSLAIVLALAPADAAIASSNNSNRSYLLVAALFVHPTQIRNKFSGIIAGRTGRAISASHQSSPLAATRFEEISVSVPQNINDNHRWVDEAAQVLEKWGAVALVSEENSSGGGLIAGEICDNANHAATSRMEDMHRRIESRGLDPSGVEEPYRFSEIVCRDEGGKRFDVPVAFLGGNDKAVTNRIARDVGSGRIGTPLAPFQHDAIKELHNGIDEIAKPVVDALWQRHEELNSHVAASGFLINKPGSQSQNWHRDGPDEGFIDCFVPLIDLTQSVGPTAIIPGTHTSTCSVDAYKKDGDCVPILNKGELLLFDYRTIHRGQGNRSKSTTRTLAYTVYKRMESGSRDFSGDVHNFPAALTLEYD